MKSVLRLATVDPDERSRTVLKSMLVGVDTVWLEAECARYEVFMEVARQTLPDIAVVNLDSNPQRGLQLVGDLARSQISCAILVVSSSQEGSLILQAMRNGAREFLNLPLQLEDFVAALDRLRVSLGGSGTEGASRSGTIVTVAGVSGGVGCTALAVNAGAALAIESENSPVIIDLDLTLGDADVWLDIIPEYTIKDIVESINRLDYGLLKRSLTRHSCGAFLLPRPIELEHAEMIRPDDLRRILALLKATFSHLIIDISKSFNRLDMAVMEVSDRVLLVTQLDLSCLRNVIRIMQLLDHYPLIKGKVEIIVSRVGLEDCDISLNKALETIGRSVYWQLPNDYSVMSRARNNGIPLAQFAPRAKLTKSISEMIHRLTAPVDPSGRSPDEPVKKRGGLFGLFAGR